MQSIFVEGVPAIAIKCGLAFISAGDDYPDIVTTIASLQAFVLMAEEALAKWRTAQLNRVLEFPKH